MALVAALTIVAFSFLYWQVSYFLWLSGLTLSERTPQNLKKRKWWGIWTLFLLSPLVPIYIFVEEPGLLVLGSAFLPIVTILLLGWRGKDFSLLALLLLSSNGANTSLLFLTGRLDSIRTCIDKAVTLAGDQRLTALAICGENTRFWFNLWITMALALVTVFGGALLSMFLLKKADIGSNLTAAGMVTQRRNSAILFTLSVIWLLVAGFSWVGVKAIQYLIEITLLPGPSN